MDREGQRHWALGVMRTGLFQCYTTNTGTSNIVGQTFNFFVKKDASGEDGETPGESEQPTLSPRNLEFSEVTATATIGQAFTRPTLSGDKIDDVQYSSSNTAVATVDPSTGVVTLVSTGTTEITAYAPATTQYEAGEATYTLTVNPAQNGDEQPEQWTLTITSSSLKILNSSQSSTYEKYKGVQSATAYSESGKEMTVEFYIENVMISSSRLQFKANSGLLYNKTDLGTITDVKVNINSGSAPSVVVGNGENPSTNVSGGNYFSVKKSSSNAAYYDSIVVVFQK